MRSMMNMQKMAVTKQKKKGVLNRMLEKFAYRIKFNRTALSIQAVDLLRHEIEQQCLKQVDIANKLDMQPSALSRVLNTSEKNLELNTIADIATALNKRFVLELVDDRHAVAALATYKRVAQNSLQQQRTIRQSVQFKEEQIVNSVLTNQTVSS
nr:MAG TPA: Regulatory protein-modification, helix-turn-helix, transcriptional regulator, DNA [Caudoviricetes sp.]